MPGQKTPDTNATFSERQTRDSPSAHTINLILAAFNMLPALPLDGGRVLTGWLWHRRAVGMSSLPFGMPVEIEAEVLLQP